MGTHFLAVTGRWGGNRGRLLRQLTRRLPGERVLVPGERILGIVDLLGNGIIRYHGELKRS
ncbi:MAG: hypothetical protein ABGX16_01720 [Pirellulales bacterium]